MPAKHLSAEYHEYLASPEWQALRVQALERDGYACRVCNSSKQLDVHHRTYERFSHEDLNDLTVLCRKCHEKHHNIVKAERSKPSRRKPRRSGSRVEKRSTILEAVMQMEPGREYSTQEIMRMTSTTNPTQALNRMASAGKVKQVAKRTWVKPHTPAQPGPLDKFSQRAQRDWEARDAQRERIRTVTCPKCGAAVGQPCVNHFDEPRKRNHQERVSAYAVLAA